MRGSRGAHRVEQGGLFRSPAVLLRRASGALLAITLVALGIVLLNLAFGEDAAPPGDVAGPVVRASPTPTPSPGPTPVSSTPPAAPASPTPTPTPPAGSASSRPPAAREPLTVLNASRRTRLAARAAAEFRRAGWPIREVGNYRARVPVTTVYFPAGHEAAAALLQREFPDVRRRAPRPAGLPGSGLTVVVTREYPA